MTNENFKLQAYPFQVMGYLDDKIYFKLGNETIAIKKTLPKSDLILLLKIPPEETRYAKDEILFEASKRKLTYEDLK